MKKLYFFLMLFILPIIFAGCRKNISVSMIPCEHETNGTELYWKNAFPIDYFKYLPISEMVLVSSEFKVEEVTILQIEILISEKKYEHKYLNDLDFEYSMHNDSMIIKLKNCFSEFLSKQEDLESFEEIENVEVSLLVKCSNEEKKITYTFIPRVNKSIKVLDNIFSI